MPLRTPRRLVTGLSIAFVAVAAGLFSIDIRDGYQRELSALQEQVRTESLLIGEHVEFSVRAADLILARIKSDIQRTGLEAVTGDQPYWESMRGTLADAPQLISVAVADAGGKAFMVGAYPPGIEVDLSGRDYFKAHANGKHHYIGAPIIARGSKREAIPISIRLSGPDGEFQGVVVIAMDIGYFRDFHGSLSPKRGRRISMYLADGTVLSTYPVLPGPFTSGEAGARFAQREMYDGLGPSLLDGSKSIVNYHLVDNYPIAVSVESSYKSFLALLRPLWLRHLAAFLLFAAGIVVSSFLVMRSMQRVDRERAKQLAILQQQRQSERLSRAIIRHIPNGRVAVIDEQLRYTFAGGQGLNEHPRLAPEKIIDRKIREVHSARVATELESLVLNALAGGKSQGEISTERRVYSVFYR